MKKVKMSSIYGQRNCDIQRKYYDVVTNDYINLIEIICNYLAYSPYVREIVSNDVIEKFNKFYIELRCRKIEIVKEV